MKTEIPCLSTPKMHTLPKRKRQTHSKTSQIQHHKTQRYQCKYCNTFFMGAKGTHSTENTITEQQITNICKHIVEKTGSEA